MFAEINKNAYSYLPFILNTVGQSPKQNHIHHPNGIMYHEFIWVKEGSGEFCVDENKFTLSEGQGVFMRRSVPHSYYANGTTVFHTGWCTFVMEEGLLDFLGIGRYLLFKVPQFLNAETDELINFANNSTITARSAVGYTYVVELLAAILENSDTIEKKVTQFLENNYSKPLTLDDIADEVGMDRYALCHYYAKQERVSVMEELKRIRIDKAKRFLRYSSDSIEKIGRMCGFDSHSYFTKRFRESVGSAPVEYRKMYLV